MRCMLTATVLALLGALPVLAAPAAAQQSDTTRADSAAIADTTAHRLTAVVVTGTRLSDVGAHAAASVDRVPVREVPPGPNGAAAALAALPGVSVSNDQGSRIQPTLEIRGFTLSPVIGVPQGVSVFLDGVRINEPDAQELNFDLVPMAAIDHAELVRGPATLFGKNSLAGALLLFTKRGRAAPEASGRVEVGSQGFRGATVTAGGRTGAIDAFFMAHATEETGWRVQTPARTRMLFTNIGHRGATSDIAFTAMYAHDRLQQAGSLPVSWLDVDRRANYTPGDFFVPELVHLALRGSTALGGGVIRGNIFERHDATQQYNVNVAAPSTRAFVINQSVGGTAEWSRPFRVARRALTLTLGTEISRSDVYYHIYEESSQGSGIDSTCNATTGLCENAFVPEVDAALFAQGVYAVSPSLSLTASMRGDYVRVPFRDRLTPANDGTSTFRRLSPRLGADYHISHTVTGYTSVSTGFRAPAALELACADPTSPCPLPSALGDDPPLKPVTVVDVESGVTWTPCAGASLGISVYHTDVHDEIAFVSSTRNSGYFQNVPRTRRQGVELTGTVPLPVGLRAFGSYTFLDATYRSTVQLASALPSDVARPGDVFPLSPRHRVTLGVGFTHVVGGSVLDGALSMRAVSSQYLRGDEGNTQRQLPGYAVTGLRLTFDRPRFSITGYVTNLFDSRYESFGTFADNPLGPLDGNPRPQPERWLTPGYPRGFALSFTVKR